jgi:hypothetical protein
MRPRRLLPIVVIALAACTGGAATTSPLGSAAVTPPSGGVDPLVPYSPATTPFAERTTGFIPDTLTLPTRNGGALHVTPATTTMNTVWVNDTRALAVYLVVENPGDRAWAGRIGANAEVVDEDARTYPAVPPAPGDLHPTPERYDGVNRSLLAPARIGPGDEIEGVLVFHVTEGNRPITIRISLDGGTIWGEWATNLGVF